MYTLTHQNGKVNYGLKKFIVDSVEDIEKVMWKNWSVVLKKML